MRTKLSAVLVLLTPAIAMALDMSLRAPQIGRQALEDLDPLDSPAPASPAPAATTSTAQSDTISITTSIMTTSPPPEDSLPAPSSTSIISATSTQEADEIDDVLSSLPVTLFDTVTTASTTDSPTASITDDSTASTTEDSATSITAAATTATTELVLGSMTTTTATTSTSSAHVPINPMAPIAGAQHPTKITSVELPTTTRSHKHTSDTPSPTGTGTGTSAAAPTVTENTTTSIFSGVSKTWKIVGVAVITLSSVGFLLLAAVHYEQWSRFASELVCRRRRGEEGAEELVPDWQKADWMTQLPADDSRYPSFTSMPVAARAKRWTWRGRADTVGLGFAERPSGESSFVGPRGVKPGEIFPGTAKARQSAYDAYRESVYGGCARV